jgi:hypothetical protein
LARSTQIAIALRNGDERLPIRFCLGVSLWLARENAIGDSAESILPCYST